MFVVSHLPECLKLPSAKRAMFLQELNQSIARFMQLSAPQAKLVFVLSGEGKERSPQFISRTFDSNLAKAHLITLNPPTESNMLSILELINSVESLGLP
jgi:hypothetical protein